jgi:hypothetical protein
MEVLLARKMEVLLARKMEVLLARQVDTIQEVLFEKPVATYQGGLLGRQAAGGYIPANKGSSHGDSYLPRIYRREGSATCQGVLGGQVALPAKESSASSLATKTPRQAGSYLPRTPWQVAICLPRTPWQVAICLPMSP